MYPVCSFCGRRPVAAWFEGPAFRRYVDSADKVRADEAHVACAECRELVTAEDRDGLARRGMTRVRADRVEERSFASVRAEHSRFWTSRATAT